MLAITIFCLAYFGIALGKIPGLIVDRVGVALLGAIAMVVFGVVTIEGAVGSINLPTILLLYSLMIISAQLRLGGFYTWVALKIVPYYTHPRLFLLIIMLVSALLSALLANDIVCFAFTPILALSLVEAKLNPLPFLIGKNTVNGYQSKPEGHQTPQGCKHCHLWGVHTVPLLRFDFSYRLKSCPDCFHNSFRIHTVTNAENVTHTFKRFTKTILRYHPT